MTIEDFDDRMIGILNILRHNTIEETRKLRAEDTKGISLSEALKEVGKREAPADIVRLVRDICNKALGSN